jgi:AhpD family alkylhydroperoxidase
MTTQRSDGELSEKDQEIIAVGASVAAGCLPCTTYHRRAAAGAGAAESDILQAVRDATQVRRAATEIMARAGGLSADEAGPPPAGAETRTLLRELVSVGAAYALNCSTSLKTHLEAARAAGATGTQMLTAIKIACAIRDVAGEKARAAAGAVLRVGAAHEADCGCADDDVAPGGGSKCAPDPRAATADAPCCCQTSDDRRSDD